MLERDDWNAFYHKGCESNPVSFLLGSGSMGEAHQLPLESLDSLRKLLMFQTPTQLDNHRHNDAAAVWLFNALSFIPVSILIILTTITWCRHITDSLPFPELLHRPHNLDWCFQPPATCYCCCWLALLVDDVVMAQCSRASFSISLISSVNFKRCLNKYKWTLASTYNESKLSFLSWFTSFTLMKWIKSNIEGESTNKEKSWSS